MTLLAFAAERCAPALLLLVLSAGACCRLLSPACEALSSKPDTHRYCCRTMGQTNGRSLDGFTDPALHTMWAVPVMGYTTCWRAGQRWCGSIYTD